MHEDRQSEEAGVRWHEAGHLVAAIITSSRPICLIVGQQEGQVLCTSRSDFTQAVVAVAGAVAATIAGCASYACELSTGDDEAIPAGVDRDIAWDTAHRLLTEHWPKVARVAEQLKREPVMTGSRAKEVAHGADPQPRYVFRELQPVRQQQQVKRVHRRLEVR